MQAHSTSSSNPPAGLQLLAVVVGGSLGTAIRYACSFLPAFSWYFYTGTFVANILACGAYALLTSYLADALAVSHWHKQMAARGLGMGLCGGLSTMSTLLVEVFTTARDQRLWSAIFYLLLTLSCGLLLAWVGSALGSRLAAKKQAQG